MELTTLFLLVFVMTILVVCFRIAKDVSNLHLYVIGNARILSTKAVLEIYSENYDEARRIIKRAKGMILVYGDKSYSIEKLDVLMNKITLLESVSADEKKVIVSQLKDI